MGEGQRGGVQTEAAVGRTTVEPVTHDGCVKPFGVGTVHAQLVGAPGMRGQQHTGASVASGYDPVVGDGNFAMVVVDHLSRPVERVRTQREADGASDWASAIGRGINV